MAVKAPAHRLSMVELDIGMFILEFPLFSVHLHRGMTATTGKHALCYGGGRDGKFLTCATHKGDEINPR